jgi:hypothetical protein
VTGLFRCVAVLAAACFLVGGSAASAQTSNRGALGIARPFVLHGIHAGVSRLGPTAPQPCSFSLTSKLGRNDVAVEIASTSIDLATCTMRGIRTVTPGFKPVRRSRTPVFLFGLNKPDYIPGCPCQSNVRNKVWVEDVVHIDLHEVWAQVLWTWNGASVWNFSCLGGKRIVTPAGGWSLRNGGAEYCPERPDAVHVRDRVDNVIFEYAHGGTFCYYGGLVTYRNVYLTGGVTGGVATGQIVNIDAPFCPPLSVHTQTQRF